MRTRFSQRSPDAQQLSVFGCELDDDRFFQRRMRNTVRQNDPASFRRSLPHPRPSHVHNLVVAKAYGIALLERFNGNAPGLLTEDAATAPRWIFNAAKRDEEHRADGNPDDVQRPESARRCGHGSYNNDPMMRTDIEKALLEIVRKEKNIPDENLSQETPLADAGIDSLDALTILFAIEEHFKISIPDDRARKIKTFGDMIDAVETLTAAR